MQTPTLAEIEATRHLIDPYVVETPVWRWQNRHITELTGPETEVFLKLELFQHTGSFKPRGALRVMLGLASTALARGVTAVSAGNHAIAVGYAAHTLGTTAKVVMPHSANPARVALCRSYGAEVVLVDDVHAAFARVRQIEQEEGRVFVHPFEGPLTSLGTATVGLEWCRQVPEMDAVIVPIGGGGLLSGIAAAVKLMQPRCTVIGVEPEGADTMHRSFAAGTPQAIDKVRTIADSLGAPAAEPYSFGLCRQFVDRLVRVTDDEIRRAMGLLYQGVKLAAEPAGAAATAALVGPLREQLRGQRVGVIVCGSNLDPATFAAQAVVG
ncbi:MAG: threonine/serine dehydratase [Anaerolineae bacterium]